MNRTRKKGRQIYWYTLWTTLVIAGLASALVFSGNGDYGISLFCGLPIALGVISGLQPRTFWPLFGMSMGLLTIAVAIILSGFEGTFCIILGAPILLAGAAIGWAIGKFFKKDDQPRNKFKVAFIPAILVLGFIYLENQLPNTAAEEAVTLSSEIQAPPKEVYQAIIQVDTVAAENGWAHNLGLLRPTKCLLTKPEVGGQRICEFQMGRIVETIKVLEPNEKLVMDVTAYELPAGQWFNFHEDVYQLAPSAKGTKITRTTTYSSSLKPRWYWSSIEALTVESQQDLVFRNLKLDLQ